ncbi:MAG: 2,3-bisphosphoglycerate-independent phosphoglycerate mutase [Proteobacteria bacterium]|nr:2,3-bisphosphoglycerate-independent phosphoglycerate mutase [Pseudomonadota bacterium]
MKPTLLCILDGFGIGDNSDKYNAIAQAHMPNYHRIIDSYPHSKLQTSGLAVGLPDGQIGNSEVGHTTIGSGRVIYQDLPKINKAINEGVFENNPILKNLISNLLSSGKACHLMGLFSDGGVHSHFQHIIFLANLLAKNGVKVFIHAFLDGRDVAQKSALQYFNFAKNHLDLNVKFATIAGRYYAMDRDKKWDRIELATNAIVFGKATNFANPIVAVEENYQHNITDEFVKPCTIGNYSGISEGDGLIFANFRADRARQISQKLFELCKFSNAVALTEYSSELSQHYQILFPHQEIKNSLPEILAHHKLKQLRIAETEKYAHVTFFFSCGREQEFEGENRILVQSPMVATYDLKPEMSCAEVGSKLIEAINSNQFDFIVANFANPDMVGHSGLLEPSIKACEAIDKQLGDIEKAILAKNGSMIITADHGNIECMRDHKNQPHTAHTTNPVPFVFIAKQSKQYKLKDGALNDIAPSILYLLNIEKPNEMDGKNLIIKT